MTHKKGYLLLLTPLGGLVLAFVITTLLIITVPQILLRLVDGNFSIVFLFFGLMVSFAAPFGLVMTLFIQLTQKLYALSPEDAEGLVNRIILGLPVRAPVGPIWRVQDGRALPDGPEVMQRAGGPGFLSIGHDSAVITSRVGKLRRVLGPGFYGLESFEQIWDVVDLRPQRRTVRVEVMTRDGIPVYCDADIRFRVREGDYAPSERVPYPFSPEAVLNLATMAKRRRGDNSIQYWPERAADGVLDGEIRDRLELYRLDEFLINRSIEETPLIARLEAEITEVVQAAGADLGLIVEEVHLGPVLPTEEDISHQWLEIWQSEWQRYAAEKLIEGEAAQQRLVEIEEVRAQVELVSQMLANIQQVDLEKQEIEPQLVMLRFLDVIRAMGEREPMIRHLMFQQAESLRRLLYSLQPHESTWPQPGSPPPKNSTPLPPA